MRMAKKGVALATALGVALLAPSSAAGQQQQQGNVTTDKAARGKVEKDGWLIPGSDRFTEEGETRSVMADGVEVYQKKMRSPVKDPLVNGHGHTVGPDAVSKPGSRLLAVREFHSYEVGGRTFAYLVLLVPVEVAANGARTYFGAMYSLYYYDEDGDGVFETRYSALRSLKVPAWARP